MIRHAAPPSPSLSHPLFFTCPHQRTSGTAGAGGEDEVGGARKGDDDPPADVVTSSSLGCNASRCATAASDKRDQLGRGAAQW